MASVAEINKIKRDTKAAQRIADRMIKKLQKKPAVEQRMLQMAQPQNLTGISRPKDFDFDKIRTQTQFENKKQNMEERSDKKFFSKRMEQMKENFTKLIDETFNSDADELVNKLKSLPADDFYELYLIMSSEMDINFAYIYTQDANGNETNSVVSKIDSYIERYFAGKINMDLKGF